MFKKIFVSSFLSLFMIFGMMNFVYAVDFSSESAELSLITEDGIDVTVVVPKEIVKDINNDELQFLINSEQLRDGDSINVHEVVSLDEETYKSSIEKQGRLFYNYNTILNYGSEYKAQDYFVISVAKGQTTTLSSKFSKTLSVNFGVDVPYVKADIGNSVTSEYSITHKFEGPSSSNSYYNSREYRVQFYAKTVNWKQEKISSGKVIETRTGVANVPTKYLCYSIDRRV